MTGQAEELTLDELRTVQRWLSGLKWIVVLLNFGAVGLALTAGYQGWRWWIVIPAWACLWFGLRFMKRYFENIATSLSVDIAEQLASQNDALIAGSASADRRPKSQGPAAAGWGVVALLMLAVAAFWYGVGAAFRWIAGG